MSKHCYTIFFNVAIIALLLTPVLISQVPEVSYSEEPGIIFDGAVDKEEYSSYFFDNTTSIQFSLVHNGTHLFVALQSIGTGWVSIGYGQLGGGMDGSNMVLGYMLEGTELVMSDMVGVGRQHFPDVTRGGHDDILEAVGTETNGTTIEFIIPLDSGDSLDYRLIPGNTYGFFVAYHESSKSIDNFHTAYSETFDLKISIISDNSLTRQRPSKTFIVSGLALLLVVISGLLFRFINRPKVYRFSEMNEL